MTETPTHTIPNEGDVVRVPEQDYVDLKGNTLEAWRYVKPCDDDCHHPVHAFKTKRGRNHMTWEKPGSSLIKPLKETP